jgi:hypothetical protein
MRDFEVATQSSRFFFAQDLRPVMHLARLAPPRRCVRLIFRNWSRIWQVPDQARRDRPDQRRLRARAEMTLDHTTVSGRAIMVLGIASR